MRIKSQEDAVLNHMEQHGSITSLEAIELYGCTRLSAKIYDLKRAGKNIIKKMEIRKRSSWYNYFLMRLKVLSEM